MEAQGPEAEVGQLAVELPQQLRRLLTPFSPQQIEWVYLYLETGKASQAARGAGYPAKGLAGQVAKLKRMFSPFIAESLKYLGGSELLLARATWIRVMEAYDPQATVLVKRTMRDGTVEESEEPDPHKASPAMASAAVKAAEAFADRFGMPKGVKVELSAVSTSEASFQQMIDDLVDDNGLDAVRMMKTIREHREYWEYVESKYGTLVVINEAPAEVAQPEQTGVGSMSWD